MGRGTKNKQSGGVDRNKLMVMLIAPLVLSGGLAYMAVLRGRWPPETLGGWLPILGPIAIVYSILAIQYVMVRRGREIPDLGAGYNPSARAQFDNEMHVNPSAQTWRGDDANSSARE